MSRSLLAALAVIISLWICSTPKANAQDVVLSEYYNIQDVTGEWTELVVVKDNLNMVGFIITDANTGQVTRQGGPRFNDHPLWRNVRAGTIIVLWHRAMPVSVVLDSNAQDGYLEMSSRDVRFFTTHYFAPPSDLADMNLADAGDVLQIMRADSSHVHALGHNKPTGPAYDAIPPPKANFDSGNVGASRSNRITGRTLAAYGIGVSKDSVVAGFNESRGLPNRFDLARTNQGVPNINHWFWRETREPQWTGAPSVTLVSRASDRHVIEWTPVIDTYTSDLTTGYVVLRDSLNFTQFPANSIRDGLMITKGSRLGTALVLDLQTTNVGNKFVDSIGLRCGQSYTYRVYGYRYGADDQLSTTNDTTARGRQYTELLFSQSPVISKPNPVKPTISASRLSICPGDTLTLTTGVVADRYEWTVNGALVSVGGTTRVVVREAGTYRLTVSADGGCSATSDPIVVTYLPAPEVEISPRGIQTICSGDSVVLTTNTPGQSFQWLRDGQAIPGATSARYVARTAGDYYVRIASSLGCDGISALARVRTPEVRYSITPSVADFGTLGSCKSDTTISIEISNDGLIPITITSAEFPPGFALSSPAPGFVVAPGQRQTARILFTPSVAGLTTGTATLYAQPCSSPASFNLRGSRTVANVVPDRARVDFGLYSACPLTSVRPDSTFRITNSGADTITVRAPRVDPPFYLLTDFPGPVKVAPGSALPIQIQYRPLGPDRDRGVNQQIAFPYTSSACSDTLRAQLLASTYLPRMQADPVSIDAGIVLSCQPNFDSSITVTNTALVPITISEVRGTGITTSGLPVTVDPNTERTIAVRCTPTVNGPFVFNGEIVGNPCETVVPFVITGRRVAPSYRSSAASVYLGVISLCDSTLTSTIKESITSVGLAGMRSKVTSIKLGAPFSIDIQTGDSFSDSIVYIVTFQPNALGVYSDTLEIGVGPCGDVIRVAVEGRSVGMSRSSSISSLTAGVLGPGQTSTITLTIANTGDAEMKLDSLTGIQPPFSIESSVPTLPGILSAGDTATITIRYSFVGYSRADTIRISSLTIGGCADTIGYELTGYTLAEGEIAGVTMSIPQNILATIGQAVDIPITLSSATPIEPARVLSMLVYVSYNGSLIKPFAYTTTRSDIQATLLESAPGMLQIQLTSTLPMSVSSPLITLGAIVYVGPFNSTPVVVDSAKAIGLRITGIPGSININGTCASGARLIGRGQMPGIAVHSVIDGTARVEITTLTNDPAIISVHASTGACVVQPSYSILTPGTYLVPIDLSNQPPGAYLFVMRHGLGVYSASAIVVQ